jgi:hypothetical protein
VAVLELELVRVVAPEHEPVAEVLVRDRVAVLELELVRVVAPEHEPVAEVLVRDRVAAEPELGPVVARLRTQLVTAVHHPGQVPLRGAEDLGGAAAEIMREPAAPGAAVAWAVGVIAAAAVVLAEVVVVVSAAVGGAAAVAEEVAAGGDDGRNSR